MDSIAQDIYYKKQTPSCAIFTATLLWNSAGHLLHKTNPDLSYFKLSYVFWEHNYSVGPGITVVQRSPYTRNLYLHGTLRTFFKYRSLCLYKAQAMRLVRYILPSSYVISKCWLQETAHKKEKQFLWSNIDSSSQKRSTWKILVIWKLCANFLGALLWYFSISISTLQIYFWGAT